MMYSSETVPSVSPGSLIKVITCFNFKFSCVSMNQERRLAAYDLGQDVDSVWSAP